MNPIKKRIFVAVLKFIISLCTIALTALGAVSLSSCSVNRGIIKAKVTQSGWIIINDTLRLSRTNEKEVGGMGEGVPHTNSTLFDYSYFSADYSAHEL